MKKLIFGLCMIVALGACKEKNKTEAQEKPTIKIGATLHLSSNLAYIGQGAKNALEMVLEKWNNVDTKYKYEIIYEDDFMQSKQAVLNINKFISIDKVKTVISVFGIVDRPVDEIANKNQIISLSCSHGKSDVPEYGINTGSQNEEVYAVVVDYLSKMQAKKIALVGSNSSVSNALLGYAAEHLKQKGIEIVADERYAIGERDYRMSIQKIEQQNPDYYLVFGVEPMNSLFAKQYYELTRKNNLISLGAFANISLDVFPSINGVLSAYIPWSEEFDKAYTQKYHTRVENCSANLYDGLDMIIKAYEVTPPRENEIIPDNEDVLKTIKKFKVWNGSVGKMPIEKSGIVRPQVEMRMYNNGKWEIIKE